MRSRPALKITSRTSSITNSFVQAIIPSVLPLPGELEEALAVLGMSLENISCIYCGASASDWDHLRPLVRGRRPTGYIDDVRNRVPCCGRCNQSKSGKDWRLWISGSARGAPSSRGVPDIAIRIATLEKFEAWGKVEPLPLDQLVPNDLWSKHWENHDAVLAKMREAQLHADILRVRIKEALESKKDR